MQSRIGLVLGAASALAVLKLLAAQSLGCSSCGPDSLAMRDLVVGGGLVAGVYLGLAWLETAPLRKVAVHLAGLSAAVFGVFTLAG